MRISPNIQRRKKTLPGFSLIELIVVCAILSFLGTVLYATFYQGTNLWKRAQVDRGEYRDIFFAERLTQDLRNAFSFSQKKTKGRENEFEFYALLPGSELGLKKSAAELQFPCRVRYYFEASDQQVYREIQSYSQVLTSGKQSIKTRAVFRGAQSLKWMFMGRNKTSLIRWQRNWEKDYLPNGIKLSIEYEGHKQVFIRTLNIPGGGRPERVPRTA